MATVLVRKYIFDKKSRTCSEYDEKRVYLPLKEYLQSKDKETDETSWNSFCYEEGIGGGFYSEIMDILAEMSIESMRRDLDDQRRSWPTKRFKMKPNLLAIHYNIENLLKS